MLFDSLLIFYFRFGERSLDPFPDFLIYCSIPMPTYSPATLKMLQANCEDPVDSPLALSLLAGGGCL